MMLLGWVGVGGGEGGELAELKHRLCRILCCRARLGHVLVQMAGRQVSHVNTQHPTAAVVLPLPLAQVQADLVADGGGVCRQPAGNLSRPSGIKERGILMVGGWVVGKWDGVDEETQMPAAGCCGVRCTSTATTSPG